MKKIDEIYFKLIIDRFQESIFERIDKRFQDNLFYINDRLNRIDKILKLQNKVEKCEWHRTYEDMYEKKETKKIEKIDLSEWSEITYELDNKTLNNIFANDFNRNMKCFVEKINELIDHINKLEKESE